MRLLDHILGTKAETAGAVTAPPLAVLIPVLALVGLAGCSADKVATYEPITDPTQLFVSLGLNHHGVTMATGDTLRLVATPYDAAGGAMEGLPAPIFRSSDTNAVTVDSVTGLLAARQVRDGVSIIAQLVAPGNVRHVDTATVNVTSAPVTIATFSIHPTGADSNNLALFPPGGFFGQRLLGILPVFSLILTGNGDMGDLHPRLRALDAAQNQVPSLVIEYVSLDSNIAKVPGGILTPIREGQAHIVARTTAYGVDYADTVVFNITAPTLLPMVVQPGTATLFGPGGTRRIRQNGIVVWGNALDRSVTLTSDHPADVQPAPTAYCNAAALVAQAFYGGPGGGTFCNGGDITLIRPDSAAANAVVQTVQMQQFPIPGTYTYRDATTGLSGSIIVTEAPSTTP